MSSKIATMVKAPAFAAAFVTLGLTALGLPNSAHASAWPQDQGKGQVIVTGSYSSGEPFSGSSGYLGDVPKTDKAEVYSLIEYGVTPELTAFVIPSFSDVKVSGGGAPDQYTGAGYTELGGHYTFAKTTSDVFSVQASVRIPGASDGSRLAQTGQTDTQFDARVLWGRKFSIGHVPAFFDEQLGVRFRNGGPPDELHDDFTLGAQLSPKWLLLAQSFNVVSLGSGGSEFPQTNYHKAALSLVRHIDDHWSLQVGGMTTIAGHNALKETGAFLAVWRRF